MDYTLRSYFHSKHPLNSSIRNLFLNLNAVKKIITHDHSVLKSQSFLCFAFTDNQLKAVHNHADEDFAFVRLRKLHVASIAVMILYFTIMLPMLSSNIIRRKYNKCGLVVHRGIYIYYYLIIKILKPKRILLSSNFGISTSPIIFICRQRCVDLHYVPHSRSSSYYKRFRHNYMKLFIEDSQIIKAFPFCEIEFLQIQKKPFSFKQADDKTVVIFLNLLDADDKIHELVSFLDERSIGYAIKKHPRDKRVFVNELVGLNTEEIPTKYNRILVSNSSVYFDLRDAGGAPYFYNLGSLSPVYQFDDAIETLQEIICLWEQ